IVRVERHLETCVDCARTYEGLARTLRAVTPPAIVEAPDDTAAIRLLLLERARERDSSVLARAQAWLTEPRAIALAWLVPVLYPLVVPAIFAGSRSEDALARGVLVVLALLLACAGPAVAVLVLREGPPAGPRDGGPHADRLRVLGSVMATITPSLFMLLARGGRRLDWWYAAIAAAALLALVPWSSPAGATPRLKRVHRLTSVLLGLFIVGHIVNQSVGFVSVPSYAAMRGVMQLASEQSVSYILIVAMVALQIFTGAAMGLKQVTTGVFASNLQAVSGWYLAVFLFAHVCSPYLQVRQLPAAPVAQALTPPHLLANASGVAALPFYLLGVSAYLLHIGLYARLAALGWLAESSVRRLSYATAVAGAMVVVTVGLSLCGIHLIR